MARAHRCCPAGEVFHILNRAVARMTIFEKPDDYDAFLRVLADTWAVVPLPIFAFTAMPNHWHFVVRPTDDEQVSEFFRRLTVTHTMRGWPRFGEPGPPCILHRSAAMIHAASEAAAGCPGGPPLHGVPRACRPCRCVLKAIRVRAGTNGTANTSKANKKT